MRLTWTLIGVPLVADIFVPCHDNLLVNLAESREMVTDLLTTLPSMFENTVDTGSSLGAALQVAFKIVVSRVAQLACDGRRPEG